MVAIHYYSFARWLRLGIAYISADEATFQLPTQSVVFFIGRPAQPVLEI